MNYPVIGTGNALANNITILAGTATNGSVTVNGTGVFSLYGSIVNAGTFNLTAGTLQLSAPGVALAGTSILNGTVDNLKISAGGSTSITSAGGNVKVTSLISFTNSNNTFNTNDNLVLISSSTNTASVGDLTANTTLSGNSITGKASVEKFIQTPRHWQFLSPDATSGTQSIQSAWMEGATPGVVGSTGYGMWLTGSTGPPNFDATSYTPSMKYWNGTTFVGVADKDADIHAQSAYMTFVRGDRGSTGANGVNSTTVLRTKGTLKQGDYPGTPISIGALNAVTGIGNPYASAIDLRKINTGVTGTEILTIYVWDPNLTGTNGLGAFQTLTGTTDNGFVITPGGGSYYAADNTTPLATGAQMNIIESGQAFFIQGASNPLFLQFNERQKTLYDNTVSFTAGQEESLGGQLTYRGATTTLMDGFLVRFKNSYNSAVTLSDGRKLNNTNENISVRSQNILLSAEYRQPVLDVDTVFINMANMRTADYQWKFEMHNMDAPGRLGFLVDRTSGVKKPLNLDGSNTFDFSVVIDGISNAANRFIIVFKQGAVAAPVPVKYVSVKAYREKADIRVDWKVENEINMDHYTVERSANGVNFGQPSYMASMPPTNNNGGGAVYTQLDTKPLGTDNYYRIRGVSLNGQVQFSSIVKVALLTNAATIAVHPNPVISKTIHLYTDGLTAGNYELMLITADSRVVFKSTITLTAGQNSKDIPLNSGISQGEYTLMLFSEKGEKKAIKVMILE